MKKITYNKQFIDSKDIKLVAKSLKSDFITSGKEVENFEKKISKYLKVKYSVSCINGTAGLDLAFKSINVKQNDVVIMPVINFIASYSMAKNLGARIFLSDVDPSTGQMTPKNLVNCITKNKIKKIKAVVSMYLGGYPENIKEFYSLKRRYNFYLIEDACHAFGASYKIKNKKFKVGSCKHSDLSVFSFHPVKTITTAEGGAITTNSKSINNKLRLIKNHNILRKKNYWEYDIKELSANYRLSDINCALGIGQLNKIQNFVKVRKKAYIYYKKKLSKYSEVIFTPTYKTKNLASYHLFLIKLNFKKIFGDKDKFFRYMNKNNIFPQFHYKPINTFSFYKRRNENFYGAQEYYRSSLSLPLYYGIKKEEQNYIINKIKNYINKKK